MCVNSLAKHRKAHGYVKHVYAVSIVMFRIALVRVDVFEFSDPRGIAYYRARDGVNSIATGLRTRCPGV